MPGDLKKYLRDVTFEDGNGSSVFIRPIKMHFRRVESPKPLFWDLALEHDNVAVLLYHKDKKCFVLVKQFRPPVFVQRIRQMSENAEKDLGSINWSTYPISMGETVELCSGMMDKAGKDPFQIVQEEIVEECGYNIEISKIEKIKLYLTGVGISGSSQHLFYAEIDDTMKITEGGGIAAEGEFIEKVYYTFDEARHLLDGTASLDSPPSLLFALAWFFRNKAQHITSTSLDSATRN